MGHTFRLTVILAHLMSLAGSTMAENVDVLSNIDTFLAQQMNVFYSSGPRVVQSYAMYSALTYRGDVYDTSLAACYFISRGDLCRARALVDALVFVQEHDPIGDGRTHAAYWANNLLGFENTGVS